jgi:hypothetical protein
MRLVSFSCYIIALIFCIGVSNQQSVSSASPLFGRYELPDDVGDWFSKNSSTNDFTQNAGAIDVALQKVFHLQKTGDIVDVTFLSDGRFLNVTNWLSSPFNPKPDKTSPEYYVRLDTDSDPLTGDEHGADYLFDILWDNGTQSWQSVFQEYSKSGNVRAINYNPIYKGFSFSPNDPLIIEGKVNKTDNNLNCCYISFPIDLRLINYPPHYTISFYVLNDISSGQKNVPIRLEEKLNNHTVYSFNNKSIELLDSTEEVEIPLPQFHVDPESITFSNNDKDVPITIQSTSTHPASISLSLTDKLEDHANYISVSPRVQEIEAYGKSVFYLHYNNNINKTNTFLISLNPTIYYKNIAQFEKRHLTIPLRVNLSNVPQQDPIDTISSVWNKLGGPLTFVLALVVASSPLLFKLFKKISKYVKRNQQKKVD